jgi:hypothetical protein
MRHSSFTDRAVNLFGGIAFGLGMMYLLDPQQGRRRRAHVRDKFIHAGHLAQREFIKQGRNAWNHVYGSAAELSSSIRDRRVDDEILIDRVRAQIGHVVSHPGSLELTAMDGCVIITGPVLLGEREKIEKRLNHTRGVRAFEVHVREESSAGSLPGHHDQPRSNRQEHIG